MPTEAPQVRAAEVVGAVSLATDLGTGQPLEHTLRTAILAVRLGDLAGASPQERWDGHGLPAGIVGDAIPLPARLLHVARDISVFLSAGGADESRKVIERRAAPPTTRRSRRWPSSTSTRCSAGSTRRRSGIRRSRPAAPTRRSSA